MSQRGKSVIDLGTDTDGITFKWTGSDDHITAVGVLEINMWNSYDERSWVTLQAADALELAQWINEQLGRIAYVQGYTAAMETIFGRFAETTKQLRLVMNEAIRLGLSDLDRSDSE